jgi:uncharacterized cupredoxin-like copper-binding protein
LDDANRVKLPLRLGAAILLAGLVIVALPACGGDDAAPTGGATVVRITEKDFEIKAPEKLSPGKYVFEVDNRGPADHELIVAKEGEKHAPFRDDGITLDEDAIEPSIAGALEPGVPGTRQLEIDLKPGEYVLFCNMSGHYLGGMDHELEVG